jgi:hypothetical protein
VRCNDQYPSSTLSYCAVRLPLVSYTASLSVFIYSPTSLSGDATFLIRFVPANFTDDQCPHIRFEHPTNRPASHLYLVITRKWLARIQNVAAIRPARFCVTQPRELVGRLNRIAMESLWNEEPRGTVVQTSSSNSQK